MRGLPAAADGVEATSSSAGMPSHATAFFTLAMGRKLARASLLPRAGPPPRVAFGTSCGIDLVFSRVFCAGFVLVVVLPLCYAWIP
jgi:fucose permease